MRLIYPLIFSFVCFTFRVLADLTKAMRTPMVGDRLISPGVDLARMGLGDLPKAPLEPGAGPSTSVPFAGRGWYHLTD